MITRGSDIEEDKFVRSLSVIALSEFNRVASVTKSDKVDPLHHATFGDIKTWDDPRHSIVHCSTATASVTAKRPS